MSAIPDAGDLPLKEGKAEFAKLREPPVVGTPIMSYKVKTTRGEKAAYLVAVVIFLLSLAIAFWKLFAR